MKEELQSAAVSGEDEAPAGSKEPKRKRSRKLKKGAGDGAEVAAPEEGEEELFTGGDDGPAKKVCKHPSCKFIMLKRTMLHSARKNVGSSKSQTTRTGPPPQDQVELLDRKSSCAYLQIVNH